MLVVAIFLLLPCLPGVDADAVMRQADAAISAARTQELRQLVRTLMADPSQRDLATLVSAREAIAAGRRTDALAMVNTAFPSADTVAALPPGVQVAYGDTLRRAGRIDAAVAIAERLIGSRTGLDHAHAAELLADCFAGRQCWQDARQWLETAIHDCRTMYDGDKRAEYRTALERKKARLDDLIEILTHGIGFHLYRIGNGQRLRGEHEAALATYERLLAQHRRNGGKTVIALDGPDDPRIGDLPVADIYAAAAQVYRAESAIVLERYDDAARGLAGMGQEHAHPYRGEALRLLGRIALDGRGDFATAERHFSDAIIALEEAQTTARSLDRFRVPDASRMRTRAPALMRTTEGFGSIAWHKVDPAQVINADTCDWYVPYQTMMAQVDRSLCRFLAGRIEEAVKDLDIILRVDAEDRRLAERNLPCNYLRLRDGYRAGKFYATKPELAEFKGRSLVQVVRAELFFETEQWDRAVQAYDRIEKTTRTLSLGARAYLDYARACALVFAARPDAAKRFIAGFVGERPRYAPTRTYWRSLFMLANLFPDKETEYLTQGLRTCPDADQRLYFLLNLGQLAYCAERDEEATAFFQRLAKEAPAQDFRAKAANNYLAIIKERSPDPKTRLSPPQQRKGSLP